MTAQQVKHVLRDVDVVRSFNSQAQTWPWPQRCEPPQNQKSQVTVCKNIQTRNQQSPGTKFYELMKQKSPSNKVMQRGKCQKKEQLMAQFITTSSVKHAGGSVINVNGTGTLTFIDDFTAVEATGWIQSYTGESFLFFFVHKRVYVCMYLLNALELLVLCAPSTLAAVSTKPSIDTNAVYSDASGRSVVLFLDCKESQRETRIPGSNPEVRKPHAKFTVTFVTTALIQH